MEIMDELSPHVKQGIFLRQATKAIINHNLLHILCAAFSYDAAAFSYCLFLKSGVLPVQSCVIPCVAPERVVLYSVSEVGGMRLRGSLMTCNTNHHSLSAIA